MVVFHADKTKKSRPKYRDSFKASRRNGERLPLQQSYLECLATPSRDAAQDGRRLKLERPLLFLPLDSGRVEYVSSSDVEIGGHDRAETDNAMSNQASGEGQ